MTADDVASVLAVLDSLQARGVTGPVSVWGVQCVLPALATREAPVNDRPPTRGEMLEFFESGGKALAGG